MQLFGVSPLGEPLRLPILDVAQPEPNRMYFTSHLNLLAVVDDDRDMARALANMIGAATGTGIKRFIAGPSSAKIVLTTRSAGDIFRLFSALAAADLIVRAISLAAFCGI